MKILMIINQNMEYENKEDKYRIEGNQAAPHIETSPNSYRNDNVLPPLEAYNPEYHQSFAYAVNQAPPTYQNNPSNIYAPMEPQQNVVKYSFDHA